MDSEDLVDIYIYVLLIISKMQLISSAVQIWINLHIYTRFNQH